MNSLIVSDSVVVKRKVLKVLTLFYKDFYFKIRDASLISILVRNL